MCVENKIQSENAKIYTQHKLHVKTIRVLKEMVSYNSVCKGLTE